MNIKAEQLIHILKEEAASWHAGGDHVGSAISEAFNSLASKIEALVDRDIQDANAGPR